MGSHGALNDIASVFSSLETVDEFVDPVKAKQVVHCLCALQGPSILLLEKVGDNFAMVSPPGTVNSVAANVPVVNSQVGVSGAVVLESPLLHTGLMKRKSGVPNRVPNRRMPPRPHFI